MAMFNSPYGTLAFPALFQPRARAEGGEPVFSATIIFNPSQQKTPAYKAMVDGCIEAARAKFGEKVALNSVKMPFRDAAEKADKYEGFEEGFIFISPWTKSKPGIVNAQRQEVILPEEVWAGQLVRVNLTPYGWINSGKKGVSFALNHVQLVKTDTPRIDGRGSASSVFDDGEVDETAADMF